MMLCIVLRHTLSLPLRSLPTFMQCIVLDRDQSLEKTWTLTCNVTSYGQFWPIARCHVTGLQSVQVFYSERSRCHRAFNASDNYLYRAIPLASLNDEKEGRESSVNQIVCLGCPLIDIGTVTPIVSTPSRWTATVRRLMKKNPLG